MRNILAMLASACVTCGLLPGCEQNTGLTTEEVCEHLVTCGDPTYSNAQTCVSDLNKELKAYPDCEDELEDWVDCRLDHYCDGEESYTCTEYKFLLNECRQEQDREAETYEDIFGAGEFKKACQKLMNCNTTLFNSVEACTANAETKLSGHSECQQRLKQVYDCYVENQCDGNSNLTSACDDEISDFESCIEFFGG